MKLLGVSESCKLTEIFLFGLSISGIRTLLGTKSRESRKPRRDLRERPVAGPVGAHVDPGAALHSEFFRGNNFDVPRSEEHSLLSGNELSRVQKYVPSKKIEENVYLFNRYRIPRSYRRSPACSNLSSPMLRASTLRDHVQRHVARQGLPPHVHLVL